MKYPKVLIISNNALSTRYSNGKTIASFFRKYPKEKIAQLYFYPEVPTAVDFKNFYRITEKDLLNPSFNNVGEEVLPRKVTEISHDRSKRKLVIRNGLTRIVREMLWNTKKWKSKKLLNWLDDFNPEIIFFCAGDSIFSYKITDFIHERYNTKLVTYVTDDYILPRQNDSYLEKIRREKVRNSLDNILVKTDKFYTISKKMGEKYQEVFNKESNIAINVTDSLHLDNVEKDNNDINLVYAGSLHNNRHKPLIALKKIIENLNDTRNEKILLKIYTNNSLDEDVKNLLNGEYSKCLGTLNQNSLKLELNKSDFPIHVESFNKENVSSTKYSISTKIPEYLSLGKPIIAIGPYDIASMEYLRGIAYCIYDIKNLKEDILELLDDNDLQKRLGDNALSFYKKYHNKDIIERKFINDIINL